MCLVCKLDCINNWVKNVWVFYAVEYLDLVAFFDDELVRVFVDSEGEVDDLGVTVDVVGLEDELGFGATLELFVEDIAEEQDFTILEIEIFVGVLGDDLVSEEVVIEGDRHSWVDSLAAL